MSGIRGLRERVSNRKAGEGWREGRQAGRQAGREAGSGAERAIHQEISKHPLHIKKVKLPLHNIQHGNYYTHREEK